jgi:hypothetical protein
MATNSASVDDFDTQDWDLLKAATGANVHGPTSTNKHPDVDLVSSTSLA